MKKIKLKKIKKIDKLFIITIFLILTVIISIIQISKRVSPIIKNIAEIKINKYSTTVINKAISQVLEDKISTDDLFTKTVNQDGVIEMIDFNPVVVNQVLSLATTVVLNNLKLLEVGDLESIGIDKLEMSDEEKLNLKKGIVAFIPLGSATKISLIANIGPKIPVRLHYTGNVNSNITTKVTPYGINNALIEIGIHLEITAQVILPFSSSIKVLSTDMPIAIKMIQGKTPSFYSGIIDRNNNLLSLPN